MLAHLFPDVSSSCDNSLKMLLPCILQEKLLCLKRKFSSDQLTEESVQRDLTVKIQQVKQKTQDLRQQLGQMQTATKKQLLDVTIRSNEASKKLQAIVAKVRQPSALPHCSHGETRFSPRLCSAAGSEGASCGKTVSPTGGQAGGLLVLSGGG